MRSNEEEEVKNHCEGEKQKKMESKRKVKGHGLHTYLT